MAWTKAVNTLIFLTVFKKISRRAGGLRPGKRGRPLTQHQVYMAKNAEIIKFLWRGAENEKVFQKGHETMVAATAGIDTGGRSPKN